MNNSNSKKYTDELINIQWQADEFEQHEKGTGWYVVAGIIALVFFGIALLMKNFIFAILIILFAFTIFTYARKSPRRVNFKIDSRGISLDDKLHEYQTLESFWIFYEPPQT